MGCLLGIGAYERDVVVVTKMGAYIYGVLIFYGCLSSQFYSIMNSKNVFDMIVVKISEKFSERVALTSSASCW